MAVVSGIRLVSARYTTPFYPTFFFAHIIGATDQYSRYFNGILTILKPACYVMHQEFNIQQLYALPTLYLCVLYLSENKQRLVPLTA